MKKRLPQLVLLVKVALGAQISCMNSAVAEIVPTEDFEALTSPSAEAQDASEFENLQPEISVEAGAGNATLPYSPPGLGHYHNGMRYTAFRFGLYRTSEPKSLLTQSFYFLKLKNSFPALGRNYDLQAVSWFDLALVGGVEGQVDLAEKSRLRWLGAAEARYERVHYPRGTVATYGIPLNAGAFIKQELTVGDSLVEAGFGGEYSFLVFGKTAVKHDSFPVSKSVSANRVRFEPGRKVRGNEIKVSLDVDFSGSQWREAQGKLRNHKHQVSLIWETKTRDADDFVAEYNTAGEVQGSSQLAFRQSSFGLRWSERL